MSTIDVGTGCAFHLKTVVVCLGFPWLEQGVGLEGNAGVARQHEVYVLPPPHLHSLPRLQMLFHRVGGFLETAIEMRVMIVGLGNGGADKIVGRDEWEWKRVGPGHWGVGPSLRQMLMW